MAYTSSEKQVIELERRYWETLKDKDVDAVIGITDDPCIDTGAQGVAEDRPQDIRTRDAVRALDDRRLRARRRRACPHCWARRSSSSPTRSMKN